MPRKSNTAKEDTTKPRTTNKQPTKKQPTTTTNKQPTKKQQLQDDLDQRFLRPLLRVAIEPEAERWETEPGWHPIDRLGELGQYEGYFERCERVEEKGK